MFRRLIQRFNDMRTIKTLCENAERHANADGQQEPGSEHFILAALELPDGSARKAFERIGADPSRFRGAIAQQYGDALKSIGVESASLDALDKGAAVPPKPGLYKAKSSVQAVMQQLAAWPKARAEEALTGAHVIAVIAAVQQGVAARALKKMGVDLQALTDAARAEIRAANAG
ncbi:MAG: Clp protease N-terminal domain-containing protein [Pseudomonadota bacterium]